MCTRLLKGTSCSTGTCHVFPLRFCRQSLCPPTRHKQQHHSNSHRSLDGRQSVNTWLRHSNCPHIIVTLIDKFSELTHCHFIHIHIESVQFHCMHWQGTFHIVMLILHLEGASRDQSHLGAVFLLSYSLPRCCLYPVIC